MFIGLQVFGMIFALAMLYLTSLYYKRKEFSLGDYTLWGSLWIAFLFGVVFPNTLNIFMQTLNIMGAMQFFTVLGFMFLFLVVFFMYKTVRKTQKKTEMIVKHIALQQRK